jgi:hypothetical protein
MGRILKPYPDVAEAVMLLVEGWFPDEFAPRGDAADDYRTGRVYPPNLQDLIANGEVFCRVTDIGGNDDGLTDRPLVDIDVLAPTFARARDLSKEIQARMLGYPWRAGSTVIDKVRTAMRPHDVPWDDDNTFRFYSSYTVSARR